MILKTIRARMLAAALLPVFLVVVALVGVFSVTRVGDMDASHSQRATLLVRQVAMASEYGLFSGNKASVQSAVSAVQREPDVRSVAVFDTNRRLVAGAGTPSYTRLAELTEPGLEARHRDKALDSLMETITSNQIPLDDLFAEQAEGKAVQPLVLGYAVVELSRDSLREREIGMLVVAMGVGLVGLLLGGALATRMGQRVVQPIFAVSRRIESIGRGDFTSPSKAPADDPLHEVHAELTRMAGRLAWGRDEMEQRVIAVTQELQVKKEEAEQATLAKSRFLAAASHDLRQPTHALGMFVARMGQLPMDEQLRHLVGSLDASVQAMQDLLDGLLDLSRLDVGAVQVQVRPVRLGDLLTSLRATLDPIAAGKGLRLRIRSSTLWVMSDPVVLQRMIANLAHNAVRYTDRGTVLISCRLVHGGDSVRIDVSDTGIGISQENQTEIFREFYQVGNAGRDRAKGLGLGLNIVERSARLLGHTISLRSDLGCGTRFSIVAPVAVAPEAGHPPIQPELPVTVALEGLRVLVIEDDDASRDGLRELLHSWGCIVSAASSAQQALTLVAGQEMPDVIVSDYRLGEEANGLSAIASVRALAGRTLPACLISGDTDGGLIQAVKDAGLTLLHKPVRPAKLKNLLRRFAAGTAGGDAPDGL